MHLLNSILHLFNSYCLLNQVTSLSICFPSFTGGEGESEMYLDISDFHTFWVYSGINVNNVFISSYRMMLNSI